MSDEAELTSENTSPVKKVSVEEEEEEEEVAAAEKPKTRKSRRTRKRMSDEAELAPAENSSPVKKTAIEDKTAGAEEEEAEPAAEEPKKRVERKRHIRKRRVRKVRSKSTEVVSSETNENDRNDNQPADPLHHSRAKSVFEKPSSDDSFDPFSIDAAFDIIPKSERFVPKRKYGGRNKSKSVRLARTDRGKTARQSLDREWNTLLSPINK